MMVSISWPCLSRRDIATLDSSSDERRRTKDQRRTLRLGFRPWSLSVDLAQHRVHRGDQRDQVGHQPALGHVRQRLQIDKRGRAEMHAVWLRAAIADHI